MSLSPSRRTFLFALALTASVLNLVDRQIIAVLKPTIAAQLHWSDNDYGTLAAWFQAGAAFGFLGAGWLVDRLGAKWASAAGVAAWSLAAMAHGFVSGLRQFTLARVTLGATEAMGTPSGIKTIAALFPPRARGAGFGLSNAMSSLGAILAPLAIPLVAAQWGWRAAFVAAGGAGLVWTAAWLLATRGVTFEAPATAAPTGWISVLRQRRSWAIAGAKVLSDATWWLMLFFMPDYFHRTFGLSGVALGPPLALAYTGAAIGSLVAGLAAGRLIGAGWAPAKARLGLMLASALCVVPVPLALAGWGYAASIAVLALALAGHQGFSTSLFGYITDVTPAQEVGRVSGFGAFCGNLGGMVISKVAGLLLAAGAGYGGLFGFAAVSYLLALGWVLAVGHRPCRTPQPLLA